MNQRALVSSNPRPRLDRHPAFSPGAELGRASFRTSGRVSQASLMSSRPGRSQPKPVPPGRGPDPSGGCSTPVPNCERSRAPPSAGSPFPGPWRRGGRGLSGCLHRPFSVPLETSAAPPRPAREEASSRMLAEGQGPLWKLCFCAVCCVSVAQGCSPAEASGMFNVSAGACAREWASSGR